MLKGVYSIWVFRAPGNKDKVPAPVTIDCAEGQGWVWLERWWSRIIKGPQLDSPPAKISAACDLQRMTTLQNRTSSREAQAAQAQAAQAQAQAAKAREKQNNSEYILTWLRNIALCLCVYIRLWPNLCCVMRPPG